MNNRINRIRLVVEAITGRLLAVEDTDGSRGVVKVPPIPMNQFLIGVAEEFPELQIQIHYDGRRR